MEKYICKIATLKEINEKWDYEISIKANKKNWIIWKKENIENYKNHLIIPYYGILNNKIICELTANLTEKTVQNSNGLVGDNIVYLSAFRTIKEYQEKGYFSKLLKFAIKDLQNKNINYVTLGVEPTEQKNKEIYKHYGFTEFIKRGQEKLPDGTEVNIEYYGKNLTEANMNRKHEKSCGCIIISNQKVLLVYEKNAKYWGFPKGHIEENETEIETARREIKEEVGLEVEINEKKRYTIDYITDNGNSKTVTFFIATPKKLKIKKQECEIEQADWFDFDAALEMLTYSDLKSLFKKVILEL